jgi:pyruvate/2-oxoglutarate dehydrogenase complex dihydrolipoamide acyltransferase (E2) component
VAKTIDIVVPDLGDFDNVEVIEVLVGAGDTVEREDGLVTIETDKATMDIPSPENGVIDKLTIRNGDTVSTGDVIGQLTMEVGDTVVIAPAIASVPTGDTTLISALENKKQKSRGKQTLVVPDLGDFSDVQIIEVHIKVGDTVAIEDSLVTLETDKAAMDVPAVVAGSIESVLVNVGETVSEGTALAIIDVAASHPCGN